MMLTRHFYQRVEQQIHHRVASGVPGAMFYVRLDALREATETLGIARMGVLRKQISHQCFSALNPDDFMTALSDHEYLIFAKRDEAAAYRQIEWALTKQMEQYGDQLALGSTLGAKIGIALLTDTDALKAVHRAMGAISMLQDGAKTSATPGGLMPQGTPNQTSPPAPQNASTLRPNTGGLRAQDNTPILGDRHEVKAQPMLLGQRLKKAMEEDRLKLVFQPIVSMEGDGFERYEVLTRLLEEDRVLTPQDFMGQEAPENVKRFVDRWVINRLFRMMADSLAARKQLKFFIKLNVATVSDKGFVRWLKKVVQLTDIPLERCVFQVREEAIIKHFAETQVLINDLQEQASGICVEHFGSTSQSLKLMDYVDMDYVKLVPSFLEALGTHDERDLRLESIIDKANEHEISTLVGGVESTSHLSLGLQKGLALFQGYFLQPPHEALDFDFSMAI